MNYTTITYSGLPLDTFMTEDGRTWLTLSSLAKGVGVHQQSTIHWLSRKIETRPESIDVRVGPKRNVKATAYPVDIAVAFIDYMADKGNKECRALRSATLRADIERSIRESNGDVVTAARHEAIRRSGPSGDRERSTRESNGEAVTAAQQEEIRPPARLEYLQQWVADNYNPVVNKDGLVVPFEGRVAREAGITDPYEATIVEMEAHVARREVQIARGTWSEAQVAEECRGIEKYKQNIQTLAQKLIN